MPVPARCRRAAPRPDHPVDPRVNFRDALAHLDRHVNLEARAGLIEGLKLDSMVRLVGALADPQDAYRTIHVTGTNGKGTVAHLATGLLRALGLHVGTYTSPHVAHITERIRSNGEPLSEAEFAAAVEAVATVAPLAGVTPSYFEILTAAALSWFAEHAGDVAVVEVGLLGRFDATNVVHADVAVITSVGRDHTDGTGDWRRKIAEEKAGIIEPGSSTLVLGETAPDLIDVFLAERPERAFVKGIDFACLANHPSVGGRVVDIRTPRGLYTDLALPLFGSHQADNAAMALTAVEALFDQALPDDVIAEGWSQLDLPGRFEIVHRRAVAVVDGAHNADALRRLMLTLDETFGRAASRVLVIGMLSPHDPEEMIAALTADDDTDISLVIATQPESPRAVPAELIADAARAAGLDVEIVPDVADAAVRAVVLAGESDVVAIPGSFYVVAPAAEALRRLGPVDD